MFVLHDFVRLLGVSLISESITQETRTMDPRLFRHDNTDGYTGAQLAELNAEWDRLAEAEDLEIGTEEYHDRARTFSDEVAGRPATD